MADIKKEEEVLAEIYRNAQLGLVSIADLLPEIGDGAIKEEIKREHEEYEKICGRSAALAKKYGIDIKEPSPIKKAMMWSAIKMNIANDNSPSNVAQMMIKGTVQGITSLRTSFSDGKAVMKNDEIKQLLKDFIALEESFEKKLKTYL